MNTFSKNSFRQKLFKCAVMIIILLQAACAALTCSFDMPVEVSARPKVHSIAPGDARMGARKVHCTS